MLDKERAQKLIFLILVVLGIGYAYYTYVFCSQVAQIDELQTKLEEQNKKHTELDMVRNNIKGYTDKLANMNKELEEIDKEIPNTNNINQLNLNLYYYVKSHNLKITNLEAQGKETDESKEYGKQPIQISVAGKKQDMIDFINYLKRNPIKMIIENCSVKIMSVEDWSIEMKVNTYFMVKKEKK